MTFVPLCASCKHLNRDQVGRPLTCTAYPTGIPRAILQLKHDHHLPYPGDHGILFEPQTPAKKD